MEILCTRPGCPSPNNNYSDLDDTTKIKTVQQKFCTCCGMPLILRGRYLPIRLLGQGGFGAAFLARDRDTPGMRPCVVKQFMPSNDLSPKALNIARGLFEREAEVLEQLGDKHEQIPNLFAFFSLPVNNPKTGKEDEFFYLVQQFIEGENLEEELNVQGRFSEAKVRYVLEEMLKVLKFVHENGSIHRDIKPSNIMRDKNNRLYLLDFGAVKQIAAGGVPGVDPGRSTGIYTPGYAPHEQMQGSQVYPCSDLYALAATCLYLLTGKPPEELYDNFNSSWNWQAFAPSTSSQLTQVLNQMLQASPKDRPQSAEAVLQKLKQNISPVTVQPTNIQNPILPQPNNPVTFQPTNIQNPTLPQPNNPVTFQPTNIQTPLPPPPPPPRFSLLQILAGAAFTGFETGFVALGVMNFLHLLVSPLLLIISAVVVAILFFLQYTRTIEGKDLLIFAAISLGLMFIPALNHGIPLNLIMGSIVTAAFFVAITAIFRLIYLLISRIF